jgi:hypothetical protein
MRKMILAAAMAALATASVATAQDWPNEWPPSDFKWSYLWPVNRAVEARDIKLGPEFRNKFVEYMKFAEDKNYMGQSPSYWREIDFRPDIKAVGIEEFIGRMSPGVTETWKGKGYDGSFKLVGNDFVGPFSCRQAEFTMKNKTGSATIIRLFCQDEKTGKWHEIRW